VHTASGQIDDENTWNRVRPRSVQTSMVKKSAAARVSQWVFRNTLHGV